MEFRQQRGEGSAERREGRSAPDWVHLRRPNEYEATLGGSAPKGLLDQGRLADARASPHQYSFRPPRLGHALDSAVEVGKLGLPSDDAIRDPQLVGNVAFAEPKCVKAPFPRIVETATEIPCEACSGLVAVLRILR